MTIQRQYILPNCSLILEGLSTDPSSQVLSILANAECKIVGIDQPISGGLEFFQALVRSVSHYAQGILSGLPHPPLSAPQSNLVQIKPDKAGLYHHLWVQDTMGDAMTTDEASETASGDGTSASPGMTEVKLSTVQLFDLAEAIDQFFADTQTLPDLKLQLVPLSKRFVKSSEPLVQRATPPLLGTGLLVAAAIGCFFLPIPEIPEVDPTLSQSGSQVESLAEGTVDGDGGTPEGSSGDNPDLSATPNETDSEVSDTSALGTESATVGNDNLDIDNGNLPQIEDEGQIATLQAQITEQLTDQIQASEATFDEALIYRVSVAENGDVVGYRHQNDAALTYEEATPLPQLTYELVDESSTRAERITQFKVIFDPSGAVEVTPWENNDASTSSEIDASSESESESVELRDESEAEEKSLESRTVNEAVTSASEVGTLTEPIVNEIETRADIVALNSQLRRSVVREQGSKTFEEMLTYRVRVSEDGTVVGYEANTPAAEQAAIDTPLPNLVKAVDTETPQVDFRLVLQPNGVVEVSPWRGWP